ncbi:MULTISPECIES: ABC transporter ATP-binding protein [unclassified Enterococcus]|uniref:ABC transporter ATP-binding protein n=1 Tax=unclassified Enterococcus TaxID=2608891 RepID=UPI001552E4FD|nr:MULTISPECIES: ABC transporter ATP-binding protein [unclassified Enterococcus]MBS7577439.1 ABC transporter ATP-binding protein [Enterococcus sp. MMGLQ5-2]MBS7584846.1 ABC transporter ATP-binding protein [Enterococcus sp. MMGLQ5-1]NPD12701.1 ABC transporter ATP-binding protein [Enterococcus sp. MMGLQ5-1]NPD37273.1 ABC transporter ATP-binding protein [Enterococcus sp. MMGLQ5-2]
MNNYQWIWQYSKKYRFKIILALIFVLLNALLIIINPLISGKIIDEVIDNHQMNILIPLLLIMIAVTLARTIIRYSYQILFERISQNSLFELRNDLYQKLQGLDFNFFNHTRVGDIMARMTGDTDAIRHFIAWVTYNSLECILWFISAVIVMSRINLPLTIGLLIVTPFIFLLTQRMSKRAHPLFFEIRESFARLNSMVEENIGGNRVVKAFAREGFEINKFNQHNEDYKQRNMAAAKVSGTYLPLLDGLAGSLNLLTLFFGGLLVINRQMTLGDLVAFNGYLWMLNQPMRMSGWLINDFQRFSAACIKIREMLNAESTIPVIESTNLLELKGDIVFKNVSFQFADDPETNVLENISFEIHSGETIGVLGETGSGKTTLINLISRFYDATAGEILIDGRNIQDYPVRQLREHIAIVMQDIFLFSNTIEENIAFGNPYADEHVIRQVAEIADAHHFISNMPDGYETIIGERGVGLSGGQKQRISLARALAKNPAILILDDTTSAVDMATESKIQRDIAKLTESMTTFIIAHRISSVRNADMILMMSKGQVVERGTHTALLAKKGLYYEVYQKQLGLSSEKE